MGSGRRLKSNLLQEKQLLSSVRPSVDEAKSNVRIEVSTHFYQLQKEQVTLTCDCHVRFDFVRVTISI